MARPAALVIALGLALGAGLAHAEPTKLPDTRATLDLDPHAWHPVTPLPAGLVAAYATEHRALVVTKSRIPNPDAWRDATREAYVDQIEKGIAASVPGYRRTKRTIIGTGTGIGPRPESTGEAPFVDLEATTARKTVLVVRVLLYRTYALSLAAEVPRPELALARAAARRFVDAP